MKSVTVGIRSDKSHERSQMFIRVIRAIGVFLFVMFFFSLVIAFVMALFIPEKEHLSTATGIMVLVLLPAIIPLSFGAALSILVSNKVYPFALCMAVMFVVFLNPFKFTGQDNVDYGIAAAIGAVLIYWPAKWLFDGSVKKTSPSSEALPPAVVELMRSPPPEK